MDRECSMRIRMRHSYVTMAEKHKGARDNLGDLGIDRKVVLKTILRETGYKSVHLIKVAQHRTQCWIPVNTVTNLLVQ
jgi:hypothetical protein